MPHLVAPLILALGVAQATRRSTVHQGDFAPDDLDSIERFCKRYDRIDGHLLIRLDYQPQDLRPLACLGGLSGEIRIEGSAKLRSLDGLPQLLDGDRLDLAGVRLIDNPDLHDVAALSRLGGLGVRDVEVRGNAVLAQLTELAPLLPGGTFVVRDNPRLTAVVVPSASEPRSRIERVELRGNPELATVRGLEQAAELDALVLSDLPALTLLEVAPDLRTVGELTLTGLPGLTTLPRWSGLRLVDAWTMRGVDGVEALPPLPDLMRLKALTLESNAALADVSGLVVNRRSAPTLYSVRIVDNPRLRPVDIDRTLGGTHVVAGDEAWTVTGNGGASARERAHGQPRPPAED